MIVAFANQKGGVAKITTGVNIAGHMTLQGHRMLLVALWVCLKRAR